MTTLVLGSKPLESQLQGHYAQAFVANGAFHQLSEQQIDIERLTGVFTPYLFPVDLSFGPYVGRQALRESVIQAIQAHKLDRAVLRPVTTIDPSTAEKALVAAIGYRPKEIATLSVRRLSRAILAHSGVTPLRRLFLMASAYWRGFYPVQDPRWKISTGMLAFLLALIERGSTSLPIVIAGIGITDNPYPENPAFIATRKPHVSADVNFLRAVRRIAGPNVVVLDSDLELVTRSD